MCVCVVSVLGKSISIVLHLLKTNSGLEIQLQKIVNYLRLHGERVGGAHIYAYICMHECN